MEDGPLLAHLDRLDVERKSSEERNVYKSADMKDIARISFLKDANVGNVEERMVEGYEDGDAVIVVEGTSAVEILLIAAIERRVEEAVQRRKRVVSIQIRDSPIESLGRSICSVFYSQKSGILAENFSVEAMKNCQSLCFLVDSHLLNLSVNFTNLQLLDSSINRFNKLMTLDLSRNQIVRITGPIELPMLEALDLSGNMLSSLNFLENLRSLKTLILHHNCITELKDSVNMLVPLAKTITVLDMSENAVRFLMVVQLLLLQVNCCFYL